MLMCLKFQAMKARERKTKKDRLNKVRALEKSCSGHEALIYILLVSSGNIINEASGNGKSRPKCSWASKRMSSLPKAVDWPWRISIRFLRAVFLSVFVGNVATCWRRKARSTFRSGGDGKSTSSFTRTQTLRLLWHTVGYFSSILSQNIAH